MAKSSVLTRVKFVSAALLLAFVAVFPAFAQNQPAAADEKKTESSKDKKAESNGKDAANKPATADSVAESAVLVYSGLGGRERLNQIRKTSIERGKISVKGDSGQLEQANYQKWIIRGDDQDKEKIRFDQEYSTVRYSLVHNGDKTFGIYNNSVFVPRADAAKTFENRIYHGLDALLRYKENGSTVDLAGRDKILGVDFYFLDLTDKQGRKTRFYVSSKTYRVMMIDYEEDGVKYRRKFYDYNYAQGTLVPYRSTLTADDKLVEESQVLTVTYGQKVDDSLFAES
jgi:hypothetical protein